MTIHGTAIVRWEHVRIAREVAASTRKLEEMLPGLFGEDAATIRRQAAGDDVPPDDFRQAMERMWLSLAPMRLGQRPRLNSTARRRGGDG